MNSVQNLKQSIQYQSNSVVSKEIISKPSGTVTLFAFDKNQGLSEHTAPFDALVIVVEGTAVITISGAKNEVKPGEMVLIPAGSLHSVKATQPFKMLLSMIKSI